MQAFKSFALFPAILLLAGCLGEGPYSQRIDQYKVELEDAAKRDTYLNAAEGGPFNPLGITFRLPKSMAAAQPFLQVAPGAFDLAQFYNDSQNSGVRLAVLSRLKNPPAPPEGQPPVQRDGTAFPLLVGSLVGQAAPSLDNAAQSGVPYKRFVLNAEENNPNELIQAYLYERGNHDVAVVAIIPKASANSQLVRTEIPLSLGSLQTK